MSPAEIEARERAIAARITKPADVPGGEWKPDADGDGWSFWQEVPPKPGELKRETYVGHLNNRGEWHSIDGQMPGQGAPALTETTRNNETTNAQIDQQSNHHSGSRGDRSSIPNGGQKDKVEELPPAELPPGVNANCPQGQNGEGQLPSSNCPQIAPKLPPAEPLQNQQDTAGANRAFFDDELSRFELEFKEKDGETHVKIRERMRFPFGGNRPSWVLGVFRCGRLTPKQLKAVKDKTLPPDVRGAIADGDIAYEILEGIFERPGKGATAEARAAGARARSKTQQRVGSSKTQTPERSGESLRNGSSEHRAEQGSGDGPGSLDGNFPATDAVTESREIN